MSGWLDFLRRQRSDDVGTDPQRFRLFVVLDLAAAVAGVVTMSAIIVLFDGGWLWPIFSATVASVALLALSLRLYGDGRVDAAVLAVCTTFWLLLLTGPLTVPSMFPGFSVLMIWPVLFALPHVSRPTVLRITLVTGVCAVVALFFAARTARPEVEALPDALVNTAFIAIGVTFVALSLTTLYGYSGRLGEIVEGLRTANEALQASERELEDKVARRTAALERANTDLESSREETSHARDEAVGLSLELVAVLDHLADGLLVLDPDGRVVRLNPALERMLDRPAAELVGSPVREVLADLPDLAPRGGAATAEVALAGGRVGKAVASTVLDADGTTRGTVVLVSDVTTEREVDRMKTDFISTVSHELRTPLTSILGFAKIIGKRLEERVLPAVTDPDARTARAIEQVRGNIDIIVTEGQRLTALINDVLDIAKMEAGQVDWRDEEVVVDDVVRRSAAATASLFDSKDLPLLVEAADPPLTVRGDPYRLEQVVINLLSNACKFTDAGRITARVERHGDDAVVSVTDSGLGVAAEDLPKLFARFKQVGDTLTGKPQGTGLGLPICKEIIEHHGGTIWAESTLGTGSTFSFRLPLAPDVRPPRAPVDAKVLLRDLRRGRPAPAADGPARILVVDDSAALRQLLREELEGEGYEVHEAADGRSAVEAAKRLRPDLVTLDVLMPELNGFDVAAVLRHDPATMHIPIMIVSVVDEAERGRRIGVDRYLTKPIDSRELLSQVSSLLEQGSSARRVVVVDRDQSMLDTLRSTLEQQGWEVAAVPDASAAVDAARASVPDVVLAKADLSDRLVDVLRAERGMERVVFVLFE